MLFRSHSDVTCFSGSNGTVTSGSILNAVGTVSYAWSNGATTANLSGVPAGTYSVTVSDNCFSVSCSVTVGQPAAALSMDACSHTDVTCFGGSNGTVSSGTVLNAVGSVSYAWSNGATTANLTGVPAGTYSVTVSDNCFS